MFLSKHHFAVELSKLGNTVYFINGPDQKGQLKPGAIQIEETAFPGLFLIKHRLSWPYRIKFHLFGLHQFLMRFHIQRMLHKFGRKADIVWSFDLSNTIPLRSFPKKLYRI